MKLRFLLIIVLEMAIVAAALLIATPIFSWLVPLIPVEIRNMMMQDGFWGSVLYVMFQLLSHCFYLMVYYGLHTLVWVLFKQNGSVQTPSTQKKSYIRKPGVLPVQTVSAVVTDKHIRTKQRPRSRPDHQYFAGFQLEDGTTLWLSVPSEKYPRLSKGGRGQLTFQGKACLSFLNDGEGLYPNKTQP